MPKPSQPEWSKYKPLRVNGVRAGSSLITVSHVTHVETALRVIKDGRLRAGLVFDDSKLNTERILVNWLSPNDWVYGFIYGNIRFTFDWKSLIQGENFYWVECITYYRTPACRILITSENYEDRLEEYDPTTDDGPWWCERLDGEHYWNSNYCLEFMFERTLDINECLSIDFVDHHPDYCKIDYNPCNTDQRLKSGRASALFLSSLVVRGISPESLKLVEVSRQGRFPKTELHKAWENLAKELSDVEVDYRGNMKSNSKSALPLARAILAAHSLSRHDDIVRLALSYKSKGAVLNSCAKVIAEHFELSDWSTLTRSDM